MERLTMRNADGIAFWVEPRFFGGGYRMEEDINDQKRLDRLAAYEDAMPLARVQELAQAEKDGRLVVLPCVPGDELISDGLAFKADHWNVLLTAFKDDIGTVGKKRVKLFYPEEAEAALKEREASNKAD